MASFTDTFERKEVKYRLNAKQHREVLDVLAGRMAADEYGRTRITSLYFDTPTRDLIARSLENPCTRRSCACVGTARRRRASACTWRSKRSTTASCTSAAWDAR